MSVLLLPQMMKAKGARESSTQKNIKLIVSDVDGTLLNSKQELTSGVQSALANALKAGVPVGKLFSHPQEN